MAKLAAKDRKKVTKAETIGTGGFTPLDPGKYAATLESVETKISAAGNAYWNCTFSDLVSMDGEDHPGKQWLTLMLPIDKMPEDYKPGNPKSKKSPEDSWATYQEITAGRIKGFFEAFSYTVDSDTDEMIGDRAVLTIGVETISKGAKAGQQTNRVNGIESIEGHDVAASDDDEGGF